MYDDSAVLHFTSEMRTYGPRRFSPRSNARLLPSNDIHVSDSEVEATAAY